MPRRRPGLPAAALCALALALGGCGEVTNTIVPKAGTADRLAVALDGPPNADHVGIFEAQSLGYFKQTDLDVQLSAPADPDAALELLAAGKVDVAIASEPQVLLVRNERVALVAVGAIVQRPLTSIVSLAKSGITSPSALAGKTVGESGAGYEHDFLQAILKAANVSGTSVKEVDVGQQLVPSLVSGRVDATIGDWNHEPLQLLHMRRRPRVIAVQNAGVPSYDQLVIVVRKSTIVDHAPLVRRFVQAVARGYEAARADPVAATDALVAQNPELNRAVELASVKATLSSFFPSGGHPWGWESATQWNIFAEWMFKHGLLSNPNAPVDASTNELLAGQGI
jgi:putative hydroxymethylpyrimidine transport system substrate-binding protein